MKLFLRILVGVGALLLVAHFLPQALVVSGWYAAFISALLIGLSNITIRPILMLLSFPITFITFGLFTVVIDAIILLFIQSFVDGFVVYGFVWAVVVAVLLAVIKSVGNKVINALLD